jgi:hypothetical protein
MVARSDTLSEYPLLSVVTLWAASLYFRFLVHVESPDVILTPRISVESHSIECKVVHLVDALSRKQKYPLRSKLIANEEGI